MKKVFLITAVVIGILLSIQVRSFEKVERILERSKPGSILAELRTFQIANEQLRLRLAGEEKSLNDIHSKITTETLEEEINKLRLLAGEDTVSGEGVELIFNKIIQEFWITDLIAQLVGLGAEAIAINDIRLTSGTAGLRTIGDGLLMRSYFWRAPIRISVIGPQKELKQILGQSGGIIDRIQNANPGLTIILNQRDNILIRGI